MKKIWVCHGGGYVKLQERLCGGLEIKCETCLSLLKECTFEADKMERFILKSLAGEKLSAKEQMQPLQGAEASADGPLQGAEASADGPLQGAEASADGNGSIQEAEASADCNGVLVSVPNGSAASEDANADAGNQQEGDAGETLGDPFSWARSLAPDIILLPPGSFGKKYPYQCKVCVTRRQPEGKIGDLCRPQPKTIKHFLQTHINSSGHQGNLRLMNPKEQSGRLQDCQG